MKKVPFQRSYDVQSCYSHSDNNEQGQPLLVRFSVLKLHFGLWGFPPTSQPTGLHGAHEPLQKVAAAISWWVDTAGKAWNKISKTAKLDQQGFLKHLPCHFQATREKHLRSLTLFTVRGLQREDTINTKSCFPPPASRFQRTSSSLGSAGRNHLEDCSFFLEISPLEDCDAASFLYAHFSPSTCLKMPRYQHVKGLSRNKGVTFDKFHVCSVGKD